MIKRLFFWIFMIVTFLAVTIAILIAALGYKVNWINLSLHETSLIWLKGSERNIEVYLDGKKVSNHLPVRLNYVNEGWRDVSVVKNGYYEWHKSFYVDSNKAYDFRDIVLFKKDAKPTVVNDQVLINSLNDVVPPLNINVTNGELTANDKLVTRFFTNPVAYQWYKDGKHIIYQIDGSIRIIDLDGINDDFIVTLSSNKPTVFKLINNGKYLLYRDADKVKEIQLR